MSGEPLEYEAGEPLDAEAQAFLAREGKSFVPTPEYDPANDPDLKAKTAAKPVVDVAAPDFEAKRETEPSAEEKASQQGWAPQDQWRGPPDKWVDAETFLKRGENNPRVLRERLDAAERRNAETIARMEKMNQQALERQKAELDAERDRLLEQYAGNPQAVKQIVANHAQEVEKVTVEVNMDAEVKQAQDEWPRIEAANKDVVFRAAAFQICEEMKDKGASPAEQLAEVDKRLARRFPEYYDAEPAPSNGAPPAGSRQMDGVRISGSRTSNYASRLPAAARVQGERFVKQGLFKSLEDYAKDYVNQ
jgi:hypothetical protein